LPSHEQRRHSLLDLFAIPILDERVPLALICSWTHPQQQAAALQLDGWCRVDFGHSKQVPPAPEVMTFPVEILAGRLTFLYLELRLLLFDPAQLGNCEVLVLVECH